MGPCSAALCYAAFVGGVGLAPSLPSPTLKQRVHARMRPQRGRSSDASSVLFHPAPLFATHACVPPCPASEAKYGFSLRPRKQEVIELAHVSLPFILFPPVGERQVLPWDLL